jgi:AAA15 family ATPase/GTPase
MLIQFNISNYKAIKGKMSLSMVASNYDKSRVVDNTFPMSKFGFRVLKSAVVYGANASGKSKLFEAIGFFRHFISNSSKESQANEAIDTVPFKFNTKTEKQPSSFEILFIYRNELYRYGFEISTKRIESEWLYYRPKTKEIELFYRDKQNFTVHSTFKVGKNLVKDKMIRENALLLSVGAQFNDPIAKKILKYLDSVNVISGVLEDMYEGFTIGQVQEGNKEKILNFIKHADLGIEDIKVEVVDLDFHNLPKEMPEKLKELLISRREKKEKTEVYSDVITFHKKYDGNNNLTELATLSLDDDESSGTQKYFALAGPILNTLENGDTLIIDELDAKLHPILVYNIVSLFNSKLSNPKNAQLIFNTHDTNLLDSDIFRRDQIWFTEKNKFGEVELYALSDIKLNDTKVRNDENYQKNYIQGKYGAIPYIGDFQNLLVKKDVPKNK